MAAKKFLTGFAGACALIVGVVVAVNVSVDVSGVYRSEDARVWEDVDRFARELVQTSNGFVLPMISERKIKMALAKHHRAECYVTGSSREMGINLDEMPQLRTYCSSILNLAVSGGGYEDALIALHALDDREEAVVIMGIGHWFFQRGADTRFQELRGAFQRARAYFLGREVPMVTESGSLWANLINGQYFVRNVESVLSGRPAMTFREAVGNNVGPDDSLILPDGSLRYKRRFIEDSKRNRTRITCEDMYYKILDEPFVDDEVVAEFESVIRKWTTPNRRVVFFLAPYHPQVFKCGGPTARAAYEVERAASRLGARLGVPVLGGFEPGPQNLVDLDFYDSIHLDRLSLEKVHLD